MPKSSSAKRTPCALRRCIAFSASSTLPSRVDSVSSSSSRCGSSSVSARMRSTISTKSWRRNCSGETFTATVSPVHGLASMQALRSTHSPSGMISSLRSAIGMKSTGGHVAALRMIPAAQRLDAGHLLAARVHDRLIGDAQAVFGDRRAQVVLELLALAQVGVHVGIVDAGAAAAFVLGAIERDVGAAHDVGGIAGAALDQRDADAGADQQRVAADRVGRAQHARSAARRSVRAIPGRWPRW